MNKRDLGIHPGWRGVKGVAVSCLTEEGMDELSAAIGHELSGSGAGFTGMEAAVNARHQSCLERAAHSLHAAAAQLDAGTAPEFVAVDLHDALRALGEVGGHTDTEDLLGVIFSRFCIGK